MLLMVKGVTGSGGGRFLNSILDSNNGGCACVADFWVFVFGVSLGVSASVGDAVACEENV